MISVDRQTAFNRAYLGIVQQGGPSISDCYMPYPQFYGLNERKCAIAHVLTEPQILHLIGANNEEEDLFVLNMPESILPDRVFLSELQNAHDLSTLDNDDDFLYVFKTKMTEIAEKYNLEVPE